MDIHNRHAHWTEWNGRRCYHGALPRQPTRTGGGGMRLNEITTTTDLSPGFMGLIQTLLIKSSPGDYCIICNVMPFYNFFFSFWFYSFVII